MSGTIGFPGSKKYLIPDKDRACWLGYFLSNLILLGMNNHIQSVVLQNRGKDETLVYHLFPGPGLFRLSSFLFLAAAAIPMLSAAPTISSVVNGASNIVPGLPNAPVAQGSIFVIYGSGLGPANISYAPAAFQSTTLSGTSVAVTVGTTTVNAPMYYTSASQVAALLPSNTPTGSAAFTVTYNNQPSNALSHSVVASNVGIFTIDSSGQGPGVVMYPDYSLVTAAKATVCGGPNTYCGAANPGDTLILWATGLGPVSGNETSGAGLGQNMPNIPLTVWLGGVQAPVVYQGRSGCCIGEDQIVFTVPNNVPTGCAVPLLVQIGNEISNNIVMPVASGSRNCALTNPAYANAEQLALAGPLTFGVVSLGHYLASGGTYQDQVQFQFGKILTYGPGTQPFFASWVDDQPPGACIVYNSLNNVGLNPPIGTAGIDAGSSFTVKGPNGSVPVTGNPGQFNATLDAAGKFLVPGAYTITGTGGADIGPFSATTTIPSLPTLVSPVNNTTVTRSNGMTVTWTGGSGNVQIMVTGATDNTYSNGATAVCIAPAGPGTFTIPPYVLLALPAPANFVGAPGAGSPGGFVFSSITTEVPFTATGLSAGSLSTQANSAGFGFGAGTGYFALK
jgi:uncharacterized protein (TIGR03437 family)